MHNICPIPRPTSLALLNSPITSEFSLFFFALQRGAMLRSGYLDTDKGRTDRARADLGSIVRCSARSSQYANSDEHLATFPSGCGAPAREAGSRNLVSTANGLGLINVRGSDNRSTEHGN